MDTLIPISEAMDEGRKARCEEGTSSGKGGKRQGGLIQNKPYKNVLLCEIIR